MGANTSTTGSSTGVARLAPLGPAGIATKPRDLGSDEPPSVNSKSQSYTATFNWELSDAFSITNVADYRDFKTMASHSATATDQRGPNEGGNGISILPPFSVSGNPPSWRADGPVHENAGKLSGRSAERQSSRRAFSPDSA